MNDPERAPAFAPFQVRSFRFQWPADLATSWALEMEALILGWFVLSTTGSVQQLVIFAALAWLGALFAPFFGLVGDRIGHRTLILLTRGAYASLATLLTVLAFSGTLATWQVFAIALASGLLRQADNVTRHVLVSQTMRPGALLGALAISRTTTDTAKVAGAIAGTAGVALVGMGPAYAVVTAFYVTAFLLSLGIAGTPPRLAAVAAHPLHDLGLAVRYVWRSPALLGSFSVAFLVNLLAFPFYLGLLPYVAKDIYAIGQAGLGWLAGAFAFGGLLGSLVVGANRFPLRAARAMIIAAALWLLLVLAFGQVLHLGTGLALLFGAGFVHSFCLTPLAAVMLRASDESMRGRVMGLRMLAVWGLPLGLLAAGPSIAALGFRGTTLLYALLGLAAILLIAWGWRDALWRRDAPANARL
jgi:MFS family permease